jgi:hypothetical protein
MAANASSDGVAVVAARFLELCNLSAPLSWLAITSPLCCALLNWARRFLRVGRILSMG